MPCQAEWTAHLIRAGKYLRVDNGHCAEFIADTPGPMSRFWLPTPDDVARLLDLRSDGLVQAETGAAVYPSAFAIPSGRTLRLPLSPSNAHEPSRRGHCLAAPLAAPGPPRLTLPLSDRRDAKVGRGPLAASIR
jgi:hypothetical protein